MIAALLAATALATSAPDVAPAGAPDCRSAVRETWPRLSGALRDAAAAPAALGELDRLDPLCADDPGIFGLLTGVRADLLLTSGRADAAVRRLTDHPLPRDHSLWPTTRWTLLSALEVTGDAARFRAVRDDLLAAHDLALTTGEPAMRRVERFETPLAVVDVYEGEIDNGPFVRTLVFVAAPKDGGMPATLSVGLDPAADMIAGGLRGGSGGGKTYFLDFYPCDRHATLGVIAREAGAGPPPYADMKGRAGELFASPETFPAFVRRETPRLCAFEAFMMPGFAKGRDD
ncbi:MAG: hypothetical protein ACOY4K_15950 [Pseudomonadota bacterium]